MSCIEQRTDSVNYAGSHAWEESTASSERGVQEVYTCTRFSLCRQIMRVCEISGASHQSGMSGISIGGSFSKGVLSRS